MALEDDLPELLSLSEIGAETRLSVNVLVAEIRAGRLGAHRVRSRWMCTRDQIEAWLKRIEKLAADS